MNNNFFVILLILLIYSTSSLCAHNNANHESYQFNRLQIQKYPKVAPSAIPEYLILKDSELLFSADLKSSYFNSIETFLVMQIEKDKKFVDSYYQLAMQAKDWKLLQTDIKPNQSIFLSEGFSRKIISVFIQKIDEKNTKIRIAYKRNTSY